jgi:hypothetical protein
LFLAIPKYFGIENLDMTVLAQELLYLATALRGDFGLRRLFSRTIVQLALLLLLLNPAGLLLPEVSYSETLFFAFWRPTVLSLGMFFTTRHWHRVLASLSVSA